jgi:hypothetical protein
MASRRSIASRLRRRPVLVANNASSGGAGALGLCAAIVALALNLFQIPSRIDTALATIGAAMYIVWSGACFTTFWSTTGRTPGAPIMRFRVLAPGEKHGHIGPRRALVRLVGMVIAAIPLHAGYLVVLFDDRRRGCTTAWRAPSSSTHQTARRPCAAEWRGVRPPHDVVATVPRGQASQGASDLSWCHHRSLDHCSAEPR